MLDEIKRQLRHYFPGGVYSDDTVEEGLAQGKFLAGREAMLSYLQTAFFDDKVLEVQLDGKPAVFFSRLKDDVPEPQVSADPAAPQTDDSPDYIPGSYLTVLSHLVILPVEPGMGNVLLRASRFIVLRMFTSTMAVEMVATFADLAKVEELPVLRLSYPEIGRVVPNAREFRAKVPENLNFEMAIDVGEDEDPLTTRPVNISIKGIAGAVSKKEQKLFKVGTAYTINLYLDVELLLRVMGTVRHLSKNRKKFGIEYVVGIDFDTETKTQAAVIESIVATVQRAHLKELAEKSHASGIELIT
jgi:hypothetical protein